MEQHQLVLLVHQSVQFVQLQQENALNVKQDINCQVDHVFNVQPEHIPQEELQQHVQIVELENIHQIKLHHV